jgi:hypothetical protein
MELVSPDRPSRQGEAIEDASVSFLRKPDEL